MTSCVPRPQPTTEYIISISTQRTDVADTPMQSCGWWESPPAFPEPDATNIAIGQHILCHFVHVLSIACRVGPGRNTAGRHNLHQAQPPALPAQVHFNTSNQRIWMVLSVCEVTARRRPDQLFHFEMPFMSLVQHVWQDRWPNSTSRTCEVWRAVMVDIGAI